MFTLPAAARGHPLPQSWQGKELPWHPAHSRAGAPLSEAAQGAVLRLWGLLVCSPQLPNTDRSPLPTTGPPILLSLRLYQQQSWHRGGMNWDKSLPWGCFRSKAHNIEVLGCTPELQEQQLQQLGFLWLREVLGFKLISSVQLPLALCVARPRHHHSPQPQGLVVFIANTPSQFSPTRPIPAGQGSAGSAAGHGVSPVTHAGALLPAAPSLG